MDKDKEAMALFQNKRHEFRCNQVLKAVSKEKHIRERELSHESSMFKARLQKLIQKRKELNLDPTKTRELEIFLHPGLRNKVRSQSPVRKLSPKPRNEIAIEEENNNVFVTKAKHENKLPVIVVSQDQRQITSDVIIDLRDTAAKTKDKTREIVGRNEMDDCVGTQGNHVDQKNLGPKENTIETISELPKIKNPVKKISDSGLQNEPVGMKDIHDLKAKALKRCASDLQMKMGNVQDWLSAMDTGKDSKVFLKRFSTSS